MNLTKKSLATATVAATALAGMSVALAPAATAATAGTLANKNFTKSFVSTCQVGPFGTQRLPSKVTGTVPSSVAKGSAFKLTNGKITVTVPASLNQQAYAAGARYQKVTFKTVNLSNRNITPKVKDTVVNDITTPFVAVPQNANSNFTVPSGAGLTVPLKAGTTAGTGSLGVGSVQATFTLYNANKQPILSDQSVNCAEPTPRVTLTTIQIV